MAGALSHRPLFPSSNFHSKESPLGVTDPNAVTEKALNLQQILPTLQTYDRTKPSFDITPYYPQTLLNSQILSLLLSLFRSASN